MNVHLYSYLAIDSCVQQDNDNNESRQHVCTHLRQQQVREAHHHYRTRQSMTVCEQCVMRSLIKRPNNYDNVTQIMSN